VATNSPWGSKDRQTISYWWPYNVFNNSPVLASQILAVLSNDPVTILSPKGLLKAIQYTTFLWPSNVNSSSPYSVFHTLQVLS